MGFETLPNAIQATPSTTLLPDQVAWSDEQMEDAAALQLVLSDTQKAKSFILAKNMVVDWENFDNMYRGIPSKGAFPGSDVARASLVMPVILEAVEKLLPSIHLAFFSDKQPFLIEPEGKTSPEQARAFAAILRWCVKTSGFKEEIRKTLKSCLLYGFGVARWGWCVEEKKEASYKFADGDSKTVSRQADSQEYSHPTFENVELRNVLFDPSLREQDCRKGGFAVGQLFVDASILDELRDDPNYKNVPTREEFVRILAASSEPTVDSLKGTKQITWRDNQAAPQDETQSVDPLKQPLEILEYVTNERIITVLQRVIVIRNEPNEFDRSTLLSSSFIDVPGAMYGFGVGKLLSGEQLLQTSVVNKWLDSLALALNPAFTEQKGLGAGAQQIKVSPGKVLTTVGTLTQIKIDPMTDQAQTAISNSELRATRRVGANGGDNMPTQALRTAEGVNAFNQGIVDKLQYFIEIFSDLVFVPALEAFLEMCKRKLQPKDIQAILSEEDGKAYQGSILDVYNGKCNIQVLSSTKLAARRAAANLVPMLLQFVGMPAVQDSLAAQGKKFNYTEFLEEAVDLAGWDINSLVVTATPEDLQRTMMMQPGAQKAQADTAKVQQETAGQIQVVQAKAEADGLAKAGVLAIKHAFEESATDKTQAGLPNG